MGKDDPITQDAPIVGHDGVFAENWRDSLPEELRNEPCLDTVQDFAGAIKQLVHHKKMTGMEKVVVPKADSGPEVWDAFYTAAGRPKTAGDYPVEVPEDLAELFSQERVEAAKAFAHEHGFSTAQFDAYMRYEMDAAQQMLTRMKEVQEQNRIKAVDQLKKEFGGAYEERMHIAKRAVAELVPDAEARMQLLERFGDDPMFIGFASTCGAKLVEHSALVAKMTQDTPKEAQAKITELRNTPGYMNGTISPEESARITNEISDLYKRIYPQTNSGSHEVEFEVPRM